jgi:serine beta-lactamase-like protein LACTB, mitochondrial
MNRHSYWRISLLIVLFCAASFAQTALPPALVQQIDAVVEQARSVQKLPAVSVAVEVKGNIVFRKAYGFADLENNLSATPETLFRTGSIAKPMTAVGAMKLVEQGRLNLDAPVQQYCPVFPPKKWTITTRELLGHISGIRHYEGKEMDSTLHYSALADGMIIFKNDPLLFEPGTKFQYTTYGYTVIGCVIEGASGQKFSEYMQNNVFTPANMTHTFVDDFRIIPHRARGYEKDENGNVRNAGLMDSSYKVPGGGFISTPEDLVRFAYAVSSAKLLRSTTVKEMWTSLKTKDGKETSYGLGWGLAELNGIRIYAHTGGQQGTSTSLLVMPSRDLASAVMINMESIDAAAINRAIADVVLKGFLPASER